MLSEEKNLLLCMTGPQTPGGRLLRSYWQPVALSDELTDDPLPVRVMDEDLVLFRDDRGRIGLLGLHCSHRGADLSYGRLEDGGLRCLYHGWLFDVAGRCLEQPAEPQGSGFKDKIQHCAYPCQEKGGFIFAYLGKGQPPHLPDYEFLNAREDLRFVSKLYQECNYLQGNEGNIDPSHLSYLHRQFVEPENRTVSGSSKSPNMLYGRDVSPDIDVEETDFGVRIITRRRVDAEHQYVRISNFVMPNLSAFPGPSTDGYSVHWHVPVDDHHHWKYNLIFNREKPLDRELLREREEREMVDGYRLRRNPSNRFEQNRNDLKTVSFSGMGPFFQAHDAWATSSPGPVQNRAAEHLGYGDKAIALSRQMLLRNLTVMEQGREPQHVVRDVLGDWKDPLVVVSRVMSNEESLDDLLAAKP